MFHLGPGRFEAQTQKRTEGKKDTSFADLKVKTTCCAHAEHLPWVSPLRLSERWIQMNSTRVHC